MPLLSLAVALTLSRLLNRPPAVGRLMLIAGAPPRRMVAVFFGAAGAGAVTTGAGRIPMSAPSSAALAPMLPGASSQPAKVVGAPTAKVGLPALMSCAPEPPARRL